MAASSPSQFTFSSASSPKLPAIGDNRNLVSRDYSWSRADGNVYSNKDRPSSLSEKGNKADMSKEDIAKLNKLVTRAFVAALQHNDKVYWDHLYEVLNLSKPYADVLQSRQLSHYIERVLIEIQNNKAELDEVLQCLISVFPDLVSKLSNSASVIEQKQRFPSGPVEDIPLSPRGIPSPPPMGVKIPRGEPVIPFGSMYVLEKPQGPEGEPKSYHPKRLILGDLTRSLADVLQDISMRESALGVPLGITFMAIDVELPRTRVPTPPEIPKKTVGTSAPVFRVVAEQRRKSTQGEPDLKKEQPARTGRQIIEAFIKGRFLGELEFAYLNFAPSRRYDPYNLVEVPKDKVNPEHFVISSHSILHITPKGPSETQSLSEWYTESCVFQAISNLSFFKNFLLIKSFLKWKEIKRFTHFLKIEAQIERSLIHNVPSFGSALLRVSYLLNDLSKITFLPFEAKYCYTLNEFEDLTFKTSNTGRTYINKFFSYCQMIVDKSQENCFEYLRYCEAQVKNHRHNYKESLARAKEKRNIRQQNLRLAREEVSKLGTFVRLVDYIILQHLLSLAQSNICRFVDFTLPGPRPEREGLFMANVAFDDGHSLALVPSMKQLAHSLTSSLQKVRTIICSLTNAMQLGKEAKDFQAKRREALSHSQSRDGTPSQLDNEMPESASPGNLHVSPSIQNGVDVDHLETNGYQDSAEQDENEKKSQDADESSGYPSARTNAEIEEDLDDFTSGLASAREVTGEAAEELCIRQIPESSLFVEGQQVQQQGIKRSPLSTQKLEDTLYNDEKILAALEFHEEFVADAISEVKEFCESHAWIAEIHSFVSLWDDSQMEYWRGQPTSKIEQQLHQIRFWTEQVNKVIKSFSTANGLLYVDCHNIQDSIVPKLNNIFKQMVKMVASHVLVLSEEIVQEVEVLSESVKEQRLDIKGFSEFIQQLEKVKVRMPALKEKVEYIKNLFEVIRSCYRQLSPEEEVTEEKVWAMWESFLFGLQEASDFVQLQKAQVTEKLMDEIMSYEDEASAIGHDATSGPFLSPDENPTNILTCMRQMRERFQSIRTKLSEISECKKIITGSPYDMTSIMAIYKAIDKRQELWRYCETSSHMVRDWLHSPFKKMNVKRAIEKVNEWISSGIALTEHLPAGDNVLTAWMSQLEEFIEDLPLLLQLSSDSLKPRHWRTLFIGIGQEFDSTMQFTTATLLFFNLGRYKDLIAAVCASAAKEHALELQLQQLTKAWYDKDFKLAKHIPLLRPRFGGNGETENHVVGKKKKQTKMIAARKIIKPKTPSSAPDLFILIGVGELKCMIEDNLVTLRLMQVSPYVADLKPSVDMWISSLQYLEDVLDIWADAQKKWLYLSNVFSEPRITQELSHYLGKLSTMDTRYREFMHVILKDSKVLSVLSKKRGDKGWREVQGEVLRSQLLELIQGEEELIKVVEDYMQQVRTTFPRLHFLSDDALLSLLAWSRNPKDLLPFVRMTFPAIKSLEFALPQDSNLKLTTALDAALNAHLLQVTALNGDLGEVVTLATPIPVSHQPQKWLAALEEHMRDALVQELDKCVQETLSGVCSVSEAIDRLANPGAVPQPESVESGSPWLLKYPSQCVQSAAAVLWARHVDEALVSGNLAGISQIRNNLVSYIDDLSSAVRKNIKSQGEHYPYKRIKQLLSALITQAVNQRDLAIGLIDNQVSSVHSFEWQSELRQEMTISEAKTHSLEGLNREDTMQTLQAVSDQQAYTFGLCKAQQLGSSFVYGYEYLGPTSRLVVTPLTRRCFLTLTMALRTFKCGTTLGPDGTGKTETIKDLSKVLGRHLVMFDCTAALASPMLVRYLSGMVRSGSWVCFEDADLVLPQVLSVFAQHLEMIRLSLKAVKRAVDNQYSIRAMGKDFLTKRATDGHGHRRRYSVPSLSPHYDDTKDWIKVDKDAIIQDHRRTFPEVAAASDQHSTRKFTMPVLGNVVFNSELMTASSMYGCFLTMSPQYSIDTNIPDNLKALMRPVAMLVPDVLPVIEVWMTCCGFTEAKSLSKKISTFFKLISDQVSSQPQYDFGLRAIRPVVHLAAFQLRKELRKRPATMESLKEEGGNSDSSAFVASSPFMESFERRQTEENSVVHGLFNHFGNRLLTSDRPVFSRTVDAVFVHSVLMSVSSDGEPMLADEIKEYLHSNGLQVRPEFINKALQLHKGLQSNRNIIICGAAGVGKTSLCQSLSGAINSLHNQLSPNTPRVRRTMEKRASAVCQSPRTTAKPQDATSSQWPRLEVKVVYPKAFTQQELFGDRHDESKLWQDGLISKYFRDSIVTGTTMTELLESQTDDTQRTLRGMGGAGQVDKWLVFDGPMDQLWMENMCTVLDSTRALCLGNGESVAMPDNLSVLFETTDLSVAAPSMVTRCSLIHCPDNLVGWKSVFRTWIKSAHSKWDISNRGLGIISCLMDHVVDRTLHFLHTSCCTSLTVDFGAASPLPHPSRGVHEVQTLIRYLSAIFDRHILRDDEEHQVPFISQKGHVSAAGSISSRQSSGITASDTGKVIATFSFAFIWAFGGHLHHRYTEAFDAHARELLSSGPYPMTVPAEGLVYDYSLEFTKGTLVKWEDKAAAQIKTLATSYTIVPEFERYLFLLDLMISDRYPVLLVGESGTGKSALIQNLVSPRYSYSRIFMSAGLTSKLFQDAIEAKLAHTKQREHAQIHVQQIVTDSSTSPSRQLPGIKARPQLLFLDDLHYASADSTGAQPPLELLRQMLSHGCLYDKERHHYSAVQNVQFMATTAPPAHSSSGGGVASHPLSPRLTRLMTVLSFFPVSRDTLQTIYSSAFNAWLQEFPAYSLTHHSVLAKAMAGAAVTVYYRVREEFRPSPCHPHFIFTQHELARIVQSMTLFSTRTRARPRPRARRRVGDDQTEAKEERMSGGSKSSGDLTRHEQEARGREPKKGRSWPALPENTNTNLKTPAVISPLIRSLLRLWCHEHTRVYGDRLLDETQRFWFASLLHEQVQEFFCNGDIGLEETPDKSPDLEQVLKDISQGQLGVNPGISAPPPTAERTQSGTDSLPEAFAEPDIQETAPEPAETPVERVQYAPDALVEESAEEDGESESTSIDEQPAVEEDTVNDAASLEEFTKISDGEPEEPVDNSAESVVVQPRAKVTFDDIKRTDDTSYTGPLITTDQLALPGEDLTDIVFCKHFNAAVSGGRGSASESASRGYMECSDSILEHGVERSLESYNRQACETSSFKTVNLVTFREALHHAARISRALATPGGHALLLSRLGYGRRTLTRLAAHAAGYKLMEAQATHFQSRDELRQLIKTASYVAGLQGKPIVVFVPEGVEDSSLEDINTLMAEGTCAGLYTANELSIISSQLLPGGHRGARRTEHQDIAQERYFRRVKSHLHVVVCLKYIPLTTVTGPSQAQLYRFPNLLTRSCCVDVYQPWPHEALVNIAEKLVDDQDPAFSLVPWKKRDRDSQLAAVCSIMAHVHLSSRTMVDRLYGVRGLKLYSPNTFLDFVDLFKKLCDRICTTEKSKMTRVQNGITRMDEANRSLDKMQSELDQLAPVYSEAQAEVKACQQSVEASQKEYMDQKEACKKQEVEIEKMQGPIEQLKKEAKEDFGKVSPLFEAAWKAINSLDVHDIEEIRSYRLPPYLVELVVHSVCLLFEKPQTWEDGKLLLNRVNFFKDLEFYDIKNMPDSIFAKLETFYKNAVFKPEVVRAGSVAAASLCMWVRAVYDYCVVYRALAPKQRQLKNAEAELEKAKSLLGEMRVRGNAIKQELEEKIQAYKDSVKHAKTIEKQIQGIQSRKHRGVTLVDSMSSYSSSWQEDLTICKKNLVTAPGDALVTAAAVCYFGPLIQEARDELFSDWLRVCDGVSREPPSSVRSLASVMLWGSSETSTSREEQDDVSRVGSPPLTRESTVHSTVTCDIVSVRKDVSLKAILSSEDELGDWARRDLPRDEYAVQNALIMRTCGNDRQHCWPLLVDPHEQARDWVRAMQQVECVSLSSPSRTQLSEPRAASRISQLSITSRASVSLDYEDLTAADNEEDTLNDADNQELLALKDEDQDTRYGDTDSTMTGRTDQTGGSTFTTLTERAFREKLAQEMGIQMDSPDRSSTMAPTPSLDITEGQLLQITADDPAIVSKLRAAVQTGVVVLVSHMERCRWSKNLELLLARQTFTGSSGRTQVVIGKSAVDYHPSFRLFLASSMPLFMPGTGLVPLPFAKACAVDMSLSHEGLTHRLLIETLSIERPEYDGQERSLERDLNLHEQQIFNAEEFVLERVLGLSSPLLKDTTMLGAVQRSKDVITTAEERQQESQAMRDQLHVKRHEYLPVAEHGALLYAVINHMCRVRPTEYYLPLDALLRLFHQTIADRKRSKKNLGSSAARAAELVTALTRVLYARVSWGLFQGDNQLFSFLIAVEGLLSKGQLTEDEWRLFVDMSSGPDSLLVTSSDDEKPDWVTDKTWKMLDKLELLPGFSGLKELIIEQTMEWREYFSLPPVLLSAVPSGLGSLTMFQKVLLWKVFREDQMFQVCQELVLYVVGASIVRPVEFDIHQVDRIANSATPVVFLVPSLVDQNSCAATVNKDPSSEILSLACARGKGGSISMISLGEQPQMTAAVTAIRRGMDAGSWVLLTNAHLVTEWTPEFMEILHIIVSAEQVENDIDLETFSTKDTTSKASFSNPPPAVHPEFRLWIITRAMEGTPLPAVILQRGLKLACDDKSNFRESVHKACDEEANSLVSWSPTWSRQDHNNASIKSPVPLAAVYSLALLHSMLHHRRTFGTSAFTQPYLWSFSDLQAGVDVLRHLYHACLVSSERQPLTSQALERGLTAVAYVGHVTDRLDWQAVMSIAQTACAPNYIKTLAGVAQEEDEAVDSYLQNLPDELTIEQLGLTRSAAADCRLDKSRRLGTALELSVHVSMSPSCLEDRPSVIHKTLELITEYTTSIPALEPPPRLTENAVGSYLVSELQYFQHTLQEIIFEVRLLVEAVEGCVAFTPFLHDLGVSLLNSTVPNHWLRRCPGESSLGPWLMFMGDRVQAICSYMSAVPPGFYCLAVFAHVQAFLSCVLMDYAAANTKSPQSLIFRLEVMPADFVPSSPPSNGVYITGLAVRNASWDNERGCLIAPVGERLESPLPLALWTLADTGEPRLEKTEGNEDWTMYECPLITRSVESEASLHTSILVTKCLLRSSLDPLLLRQQKVAVVTSQISV